MDLERDVAENKIRSNSLCFYPSTTEISGTFTYGGGHGGSCPMEGVLLITPPAMAPDTLSSCTPDHMGSFLQIAKGLHREPSMGK